MDVRDALAEGRSTRGSEQRVERRLESDLVVDVAVSPLLDERGQVDGAATAYVCIGPECSLPLTNVADLMERLS